MNDGPHLCEDVSPVCLSLHICSTLSEKDRKKEIPNFLCGHRKGHSPFLTPKGSVYTLFFAVTSAHTLLGPFILIIIIIIIIEATSRQEQIGQKQNLHTNSEQLCWHNKRLQVGLRCLDRLDSRLGH